MDNLLKEIEKITGIKKQYLTNAIIRGAVIVTPAHLKGTSVTSRPNEKCVR